MLRIYSSRGSRWSRPTGLLVPKQICRYVDKAGQLYATRTKLGWALQGLVDEYICGKAHMTTNHIQLEQLN